MNPPAIAAPVGCQAGKDVVSSLLLEGYSYV